MKLNPSCCHIEELGSANLTLIAKYWSKFQDPRVILQSN